MRKVLCLAVVASFAAVSMSVPASAGGAGDIPWLIDASRADNYSKASVKCWPISPNGSRARISCAVSETTIKKPDPSGTAKDVAELAKVSDADLLKSCDKASFVSMAPSADAHDRAILEAADRACAAHDGPGMKHAFTTMMTDIAPVSCEMHTTLWNDLEVFEQIDANTWIENQGPQGVCNMSATLTLARAPGDSIWSFAMTETTPGNSADPLCKNVHSNSERWAVVGSAHAFTRAGCKYVH